MYNTPSSEGLYWESQRILDAARPTMAPPTMKSTKDTEQPAFFNWVGVHPLLQDRAAVRWSNRHKQIKMNMGTRQQVVEEETMML